MSVKNCIDKKRGWWHNLGNVNSKSISLIVLWTDFWRRNISQDRRMRVMLEKKIKLTELEEVKEFVHAAEKCDFDIDLKYRQILIDAKSLLGVIGIGTNNDFKVCYVGEDTAFENVVDKFAIA